MTELVIEQTVPARDPAFFRCWHEYGSSWERRLQLDALQQALLRDDSRQFCVVGARRADQVVGWMVAHPQPGGVASVWGPGTNTSEPPTTRQQLHARLCDALRARGIHLLQAVVPPDELHAISTLRSLNFQPLACLVYLARSFELASQPQSTYPPLDPPPCEIVPWDPDHGEELERVMAETYVGSLDCPQLNDRRSVRDVLENYQAAEDFDPGLWFLLREGTRNVGCLLLAAHPQNGSWECTYWGIIPGLRGRGWGDRIVGWMIEYSRSRGASHLELTVDQANLPAWRIYQRAGFIPRARRQALIQTI